ncbi:hypothetical protein BJ508DRAFT_315726 [Ascobolus immersus RN42]|uniref:Uncharacterized protein n=1 Tax=Ascobolus immersus RN42 TaxID=1160509 RepID=A0A3N4HFY5_ASCIM|nr:hypothetical protein BJ508DRAFT_315726 [Ascobolus immersus RN42]
MIQEVFIDTFAINLASSVYGTLLHFIYRNRAREDKLQCMQTESANTPPHYKYFCWYFQNLDNAVSTRPTSLRLHETTNEIQVHHSHIAATLHEIAKEPDHLRTFRVFLTSTTYTSAMSSNQTLLRLTTQARASKQEHAIHESLTLLQHRSMLPIDFGLVEASTI